MALGFRKQAGGQQANAYAFPMEQLVAAGGFKGVPEGMT